MTARAVLPLLMIHLLGMTYEAEVRRKDRLLRDDLARMTPRSRAARMGLQRVGSRLRLTVALRADRLRAMVAIVASRAIDVGNQRHRHAMTVAACDLAMRVVSERKCACSSRIPDRQGEGRGYLPRSGRVRPLVALSTGIDPPAVMVAGGTVPRCPHTDRGVQRTRPVTLGTDEAVVLEMQKGASTSVLRRQIFPACTGFANERRPGWRGGRGCSTLSPQRRVSRPTLHRRFGMDRDWWRDVQLRGSIRG
jgi:hypothetical protein